MSLKYIKSRNSYERRNLTFELDTENAYSFNWYKLAGRVGGAMYVNTFTYSRTTTRHYQEILYLLKQLGYSQIYTIEAPRGLDDVAAIRSHYREMMEEMEKKIANPRCKKSLTTERQKALEAIKNQYNTYLRFLASAQLDQAIDDMLVG